VYQGNYNSDITGNHGNYFTRDGTCDYADRFRDSYCGWDAYFSSIDDQTHHLEGPPCKTTAGLGVCVPSATCSNIGLSPVSNMCLGLADDIKCCAGSNVEHVFRFGNYNCDAYDFADSMSIAGNNNRNYDVVKIKREHLTNATYYDYAPNEKDNTMTLTTACAYDSMAKAAREDGVTLLITSGFRTYERQVYFWNCYQTGNCNNGNIAAQPGTSNHGNGKALDLNAASTSSPQYVWLTQHAAEFGFERTVSSEPWHWELVPNSA
jgi:hypothetical protein